MTKKTSKKKKKVLNLAKKKGFLRVRDVKAAKLHPEYIRRLVKTGKLIREGRGLYRLKEADITEHHSLAEVAKRVPNGVICLLSALRFHNITTQLPHQVWIAIDVKARVPKSDELSIRVFRFSGDALRKGIEVHTIEGVKVCIYSPAKTVADCFKFRNKIGLEVAIEALRECWRERKATMDDIYKYAKICRVMNVMRPYMESLQ
ncbi:MAG: type IV toxin-antitoxin system AbiEi family antitoxin domain-containing protein [Pseudomonadota bacterium]|nr:type IV toxin-antitoxin system AbiEi family antitoxin domain-containing protein [Patescibacteria group bacterium]